MHEPVMPHKATMVIKLCHRLALLPNINMALRSHHLTELGQYNQQDEHCDQQQRGERVDELQPR